MSDQNQKKEEAVGASTDTRNVNLVLKQEEKHTDEIILSFPALFAKLKKYFLPWLLTSVILGGFIAGVSMFFVTTAATPVQALVSLNYDGIERGKNPDGTDFDPNVFKNPRIIEQALKECGMELEQLETIRQGMSIMSLIPVDAYERLTAYYSAYEEVANGQLSALQSVLDTSWHSTQYRISLDYKEAKLKRAEAVDLVNAITYAYKDYFFENYGYNEALGGALVATNYKDYDYPEAVDMFNSSLGALKRYVNSLASDDTARFRSTATGYTFADLHDTISSVQTLDLDKLNSYITLNNVTKDKDRLEATYEYRIESLQREQTALETRLKSIVESIEAYEKEDIFIFGAGTDDTNLQTKGGSEQYDKMISQKLSVTTELAEAKRDIEYYKERVSVLRATKVGSADKVKVVEGELASLDTKLKDLVTLVNDTANDYFQNVSLSNSYSVLVPASTEIVATIKSGIINAILPIAGVEALLFVAWLGTAFVQALMSESEKYKKAAAQKEEPETTA
ncbi:MAG TPA: lipopolysaccharide biosynthesis protein [Ruminococcus sp.]|nr:lipopolysaccharide biosynthesis protein [Ruminococcus sp.]